MVEQKPERIFPVPFNMTIGSLKTLNNQEASPILKFQTLLLVPASLLIDLAFLPPSIIDDIRMQNQQ